MTYQMQSLNLDPATLDGLSGRLIDSHHANNYGGASAQAIELTVIVAVLMAFYFWLERRYVVYE